MHVIFCLELEFSIVIIYMYFMMLCFVMLLQNSVYSVLYKSENDVEIGNNCRWDKELTKVILELITI